MNIGRPSSPVQLTGGYLGASYSATPFQTGDVPIPESASAEQFYGGGSATGRCRRSCELNKQFREDYATESEIAARVHAPSNSRPA